MRPTPHPASTSCARGCLLALAAGTMALPASAQISFSIDYRGPTIAAVSPAPITEGDVLIPLTGTTGYAPLPPPFVLISGGFGPPAPGLGLPRHPLVSVRGAIPPGGGTRFYQVFYRNAAPAFCPPGTANYTNGLALVWTP